MRYEWIYCSWFMVGVYGLMTFNGDQHAMIMEYVLWHVKHGQLWFVVDI